MEKIVSYLTQTPSFLWATAFIVVVLALIFSRRNSFKKLQAQLATSTIGSMAMGLVEVSAKAKMLNACHSPYTKTECIGFSYKVEEREVNNEGRESWRTRHRESFFEPFKLIDETGVTQVNPPGLKISDLETIVSYQDGHRHTEMLLKQNDHVLLVGEAVSVDGQTAIQRGHHKVLQLSTPSSVQEYNDNRPVRRSFGFHVFFMFCVIGWIIAS